MSDEMEVKRLRLVVYVEDIVGRLVSIWSIDSYVVSLSGGGGRYFN